jgi:hypothetical protein
MRGGENSGYLYYTIAAIASTNSFNYNVFGKKKKRQKTKTNAYPLISKHSVSPLRQGTIRPFTFKLLSC